MRFKLQPPTNCSVDCSEDMKLLNFSCQYFFCFVYSWFDFLPFAALADTGLLSFGLVCFSDHGDFIFTYIDFPTL